MFHQLRIQRNLGVSEEKQRIVKVWKGEWEWGKMYSFPKFWALFQPDVWICSYQTLISDHTRCVSPWQRSVWRRRGSPWSSPGSGPAPSVPSPIIKAVVRIRILLELAIFDLPDPDPDSIPIYIYKKHIYFLKIEKHLGYIPIISMIKLYDLVHQK